MVRLTKEDLAQMDKEYLESLEREKLINVALNLRELGIDLVERLGQNSTNSSKPPSSDNPYDKDSKGKDESKGKSDENKQNKAGSQSKVKRSRGRQPNSQGFGRTIIPEDAERVNHYPDICSACNAEDTISHESTPYMGYYVYELKKSDLEIKI